MKIEDITNSITKKLGKEEAGKIADDVANLLSLEKSRLLDIDKKDQEIAKLKNDKEMLITANGNLLQQISAEQEDVLIPKKEETREERKKFDMRDAFDEKGHFKRKI